MQTVQRTTFKPEWVAPTSLQLVAPNVQRQPVRVASGDTGAASVAVQFERFSGFPARSNAQLLGSLTNRALSSSRLCFAVSFIWYKIVGISSCWHCWRTQLVDEMVNERVECRWCPVTAC